MYSHTELEMIVLDETMAAGILVLLVKHATNTFAEDDAIRNEEYQLCMLLDMSTKYANSCTPRTQKSPFLLKVPKIHAFEDAAHVNSCGR